MVLEDMFFLPSNELPIYQKPNLPYMHDVARELEVLAVLMGEGGTKSFQRLKGGGGGLKSFNRVLREEGGGTSFGPVIFPFCSPSPHN